MSTFIGKKTKTSGYSNNFYKKKKYDTPYPTTVTTLSAEVTSNIKAQLMKNELGKFIDFRRYREDRPTNVGIRMPIRPFLDCMNRIKKDVKDFADDEK